MSENKQENSDGKFNLDQLEKRTIYQVPEGYFEKLPGIIQSKVVLKPPFYARRVFKLSLRYALPATFLVVFSLYFGLFSPKSNIDNYENLLAEVSNQDLLDFLNDSDMSVEDIIESIGEEEIAIGFDIEAEELIEDLNFDNENIDELLEEFDNSSDYF